MKLQREASEAAYANVFPPDRFPYPLAESEAHWTRVLNAEDETVVVAEEASGRVVGVIGARNDFVHSFYVVPELWRTGIGGRLYSDLISRMQTAGLHRARLLVLKDNRVARRFYERRGWTPTGKTDRSWFAPHPELLEYVLDLNANMPAVENEG